MGLKFRCPSHTTRESDLIDSRGVFLVNSPRDSNMQPGSKCFSGVRGHPPWSEGTPVTLYSPSHHLGTIPVLLTKIRSKGSHHRGPGKFAMEVENFRASLDGTRLCGVGRALNSGRPPGWNKQGGRRRKLWSKWKSGSVDIPTSAMSWVAS